ncbi:MAG: aminotransferase class I/II-fold pyridoxal phosphate-dependent enzyme [Bacilli bacterium]|nr:aminotransferase class I/II-fold pyridoxal phosphate-dependent enzyme [Bacilli bacterium]
MKIIAKHSEGKMLKNDVFQISEQAKAAKLINPNVIDATVGAFYDEKGKLYKYKVIDKILKKLPDEEFYSYASTSGGSAYREAVLNWVFKDKRESLLQAKKYAFVATPGGTGAIFNSLYNSLDKGETLLLPNIYWGPYANMASDQDLKVLEYSMFKKDSFNIEGFIEKAEEIIEKQNKLVTIINDPCHNPTGYTMKEEELASVIEYMNSKKNTPCVLIYDIAYMDFSFNSTIRNRFSLFKDAGENVLISIAFSGSKTFSVYGLRMGAAIYLGSDKEFLNELQAIITFTGRTHWSNCTAAPINMIVELDKKPKKYSDFMKQVVYAMEMLKERADIFVSEAKENGLSHYPYVEGFFITIPCNNLEKVIKNLNDDGIYLVPVKGAVRVAICSLTKVAIQGLAKRIKTAIDLAN